MPYGWDSNCGSCATLAIYRAQDVHCIVNNMRCYTIKYCVIQDLINPHLYVLCGIWYQYIAEILARLDRDWNTCTPA